MKAQLTKHNGTVKIDIDGSLYEPLSFKSFRPSAKNISDFYKAGVRIFDILSSGIICLLGVPYSLYGESWIDDDTYDFSKIDDQIELFLANAPEAYFALMLQLDTREWYCEKHQVPYTFTHLSQEIADERWKKAAERYLRAAIRHVEEKYGERFYGYFLLCGMTTEWFSQNDNEESHPIKLAAYREYTGDANAEIPPMSERELPPTRLFIDPVKQKELVTYRRFHSELISKTICEFAHVVKDETNYQKLCGVYYGYLFELDGPRLWSAGTLDYEMVYTCPDVDMISSPSSYGHRAYNDATAGMVTSDTLDDRNKLYFIEFDHITHLAPQFVPDGNGIGIPGYKAKFENENQTMDVMRRDFMYCQSRRIALWWFDMFEGWFYSDGMMGEVERFVEISKRLAECEMHSSSEVCVIAEGAESLCYVNKNSQYNTDTFGAQRDGLARMGAPFDIYSVCDLENLDFDRYKFFIFLDQFAISEKSEKIINEKIKKSGKTLLWFAAPGVITADGIDASRIEAITGMRGEYRESLTHKAEAFGVEYGRGRVTEGYVIADEAAEILARDADGNAVLAMREADGVRSIFASWGALPGKVLCELARLAGVHIYSDTCPVYVNSRLIGVYMKPGETVTLEVGEDGEFEDVFNGARYTSSGGRVVIPSGELRSVMLVRV